MLSVAAARSKPCISRRSWNKQQPRVMSLLQMLAKESLLESWVRGLTFSAEPQSLR